MSNKESYEWLRRSPWAFVFGLSLMVVSIGIAISGIEYWYEGFVGDAALHSLVWFLIGVSCFVVIPLKLSHFALLAAMLSALYLYSGTIDPRILKLFAVSSMLYGGIVGGHLKWLILRRKHQNKDQNEVNSNPATATPPAARTLHLNGIDFTIEDQAPTRWRRKPRKNLIISTPDHPRIDIPGAALDAVTLEQLTLNPGELVIGEDIWLAGTNHPGTAIDELIHQQGVQTATLILTDGEHIYGTLNKNHTTELTNWLKTSFPN